MDVRTAHDDASWKALFGKGLRFPLVVLCTGVVLHSMNALLMSTVLPTAIENIGGLRYMSWPTTAFLATSVVAASSGSVVRALIGARNGYALAALVFGAGSLIAGLAGDIWGMVVGRMVQGFGGGLVSSLAYVMIRNVFPEPLWPRTFALFSSVWGIAVLLGPLVGGAFAGSGFWRGAFLVVGCIAIGLTALSMRVLPPDTHRLPLPGFPGLRLGMVGLGIVLLSLAAPTSSVAWQCTLIGAAVATFVGMLDLDRRCPQPLLPSDAFSFTSKTGLGIWMLFLLSVANDPFAIYGPLFLQTLHGLSPLVAGYTVATESLAWTVIAAIVASLSVRWVPACMILGPICMALGLIGISLTMTSGPLWLLVIAVAMMGGGIGAVFSFISQAILAGARDNEGDSAASAIPTIQLVGLGIGAALAGIAANVTGLSQGLSVATAATAAAWVPGVFAAAAIAAVFAALLLNRLGVEPSVDQEPSADKEPSAG